MCLACISTEVLYLACMSSFNHTFPVHLRFCHSSKLASPITEPLEITRHGFKNWVLNSDVLLFVCSRSPTPGVCKTYWCCNLQDKHKQTSPYLKPQPVPPSTMAATRMAPAMEPMIRLVALGPVAEGGSMGKYIFLIWLKLKLFISAASTLL